ncbi:MAG: hypothetical protein ACSHXB_01040 [Sulfitobacter sp.]
MASLESTNQLRIHAITAELALLPHVDDYATQLVSLADPLVFVRVEPLRSGQGGFVVTDLNHSGWSLFQEARAIEACVRLFGSGILRSLWFGKPHRVRVNGLDSQSAELNHLEKVLKQLAQSWPAFIDAPATHKNDLFGVNFRVGHLKS